MSAICEAVDVVLARYVARYELGPDEHALLCIVADDSTGAGGYAAALGCSRWKMDGIRGRLLRACGAPTTEALRTRMFREALVLRRDGEPTTSP
jgi:hypothetical protein